MKDQELHCWKCGEDLKDIPRPFSRFAECPECKCELHVCRMCRHYNLRYTGQCDHDMADKVLDKDKSNFCSYFRPKFGAFGGDDSAEKSDAKQALDELFGPADQNQDTSDVSGDENSAKDKSRAELRDLFGSDSDK